MKPIWKNGKLTVELHKPDIVALQKARDIGEALTAMAQSTGEALVNAIEVILTEDSDNAVEEIEGT